MCYLYDVMPTLGKLCAVANQETSGRGRYYRALTLTVGAPSGK